MASPRLGAPQALLQNDTSRVYLQAAVQTLGSNYDMTTGNNHLLRQAVRIAVLAGGTIATGLVTSTSIAQTVAAANNEPADSSATLAEVVVTGSRIATPSLQSVSPITAISSDEIKSEGVTRVEDLLN